MPVMDPWTVYWQSDRLHSCIASGSAEDQRELAAHWVGFGRTLPRGARLVDLATGNGAVPAALAGAGLDLAITGVDRADIDPRRFVAGEPALARVRFLGGVDLRDPPDLEGCYHAVTSQFGLEYLPPGARGRPVASLLGAGGRFQLLTHHVDSEILRSGRRDLDELSVLLEAGGVMEAVAAFAADGLAPSELERRARRYLSRPGPGTRRLSGQILTAIDGILTRAETGRPGSRETAGELHRRVASEAARLGQLAQAALNDAGVTALAAELRAHGLVVDVAEPFQVGVARGRPALVGWHLTGRAP